ncbi:MAG: ubiquinone/menaquinone biosynthesis methyltransferase [Chthoniobacter sp.]
MPPTLPPPEKKSQFVQAMFGEIAERYDLANHLLSGGLDFLWRRRAARLIRAWEPSRILDLATGSGDLALTLRGTCPGALVVGADFCPPMLSVARRKGLEHLVAADGLQLPFPDSTFDVVTIAFGLRNMSSWPAALAEMRRILRPGGHVLILDFSVPPAPLRWIYRPYLHHVPAPYRRPAHGKEGGLRLPGRLHRAISAGGRPWACCSRMPGSATPNTNR